MKALYSEHKPSKVIHHRPYCSCGRIGEYSKTFDAYYCANGNVWLEKGCGDTLCESCKIRPLHPRPLERI